MGSIEVKRYFSPGELREAAALVLKHRLYVSGWAIQGHMQRILHLSKLEHIGYRITLVFKDGAPVALGFFNGPFYQIMAFTRKAERRQGYGSLAIQNLGIDLWTIFAEEGAHGTERFWTRNGVDLRRQCA